MVGVDVHHVRGVEHRGRGALVPGHRVGDPRGACLLIIFWICSFRQTRHQPLGADLSAGRPELPEGNGPYLPFGIHGVSLTLPFAVWLYLAIEEIPLAAEESSDPKRDMPRGIMLGMFTLIISAGMIVSAQPVGHRRRLVRAWASPASRCSTASAPSTAAARRKCWLFVAVVGLIASFRTIIYTKGGRSTRCRAPAISRRACR